MFDFLSPILALILRVYTCLFLCVRSVAAT